jgi:ribosomal protein S18 acetylase RimI-like enzyme
MIRIVEYNLSRQKDFNAFSSIRSSFLHLLKSAYGRKYFGDNIYNRKISKRNLIIIAAFNSKNEDKLIGVLIIKSYEKLSGLAVLEPYRRQGIASSLIKKAMEGHDYLYGEVAVTSEHMKQLFSKLNFEKVNSKEIITTLLANQKDNVVFFDDDIDNGVSYIHATDKHFIDRQKEFILFHYEKS